MEVVQLNLNHCEAAQDLLVQLINERGVDVALVSEPYRNPNPLTWISDSTGRAAVWACGDYPVQQSRPRQGAGVAVARIKGIFFCSCYAPPSWDIAQFKEMLDDVVSIGRSHQPIVIAGDFNAWAVEWGSRYTDNRGQALLEAFSLLDVELANNGNEFTFFRNGRNSVIDITFASSELARNLEWHVSQVYTHSDHRAVIFRLRPHQDGRPNASRLRRGWVAGNLDDELMREMALDIEVAPGAPEEMAAAYTQEVSRLCDASMPRRVMNSRRRPAYWWNEAIYNLRTSCNRARRRSQRSVGRAQYEENLRTYKELRKNLRDEIRRSKHDHFKKLCEEANANPWGGAYRVVMAKVKGRRAPQEKCPLALREIVRTLFPQQEGPPRLPLRETVTTSVPAVTVEEITEACRRIGAGKAPGPDAIPNAALKACITANPRPFVRIVQACLEQGIFPKRWKRQRLVLIPKPGKPPGQPSSYRPICLLDTMGKLLERVIQQRLTPITEGVGGLSDRQFGFRRARSTLDAIGQLVSTAREALSRHGRRGLRGHFCLVMTIDVLNAFNSANWTQVLGTLAGMDIPAYLQNIIVDYLKDRILEYDTDEGPKEYAITGGVPQGSVLGPLLWNIMYDGILRLEVPDGVDIIGFADDVAVVVCSDSVEEVELVASETMAKIQLWIKSAGLKLADQKTEAVLINARRPRATASIRVGQHLIHSRESVKYLGVMIDARLNFKEHIEYACTRAARTHAALSAMMPNVGGPRSSKRRLLSSVVSSGLLYGAQIWAGALENGANRRRMERPYRLCALRVASAYRTVSHEAACVIAGMMPIDIVAAEARRVFEAGRLAPEDATRRREEEAAASLQEWQRRWDQSSKGRWTYRLIPNIKAWMERGHGEVNYHLTQFLTGHGGYRGYLHKIRRDDSPSCPICEGSTEDPEHVVFACPRFRAEFDTMCAGVESQLTPDNVVTEMLSSVAKWSRISAGICTMQRRLQEERRRREARTLR